MGRYAMGVDFGTLSARALVVDVETGRELGGAVMEYPHGVLQERLPNGAPLPHGWALQHPGDYLECLQRVVPEALAQAGVNAAEVIGLGIDCTASTSLPVLADGTPLCFLPEYENYPYAYAMLWKHHGAQAQADRMTELAQARKEPFLARYGGRISSEWMLPKLLQVLEEAPEVYERADRFVEAGDWIVSQITHSEARSAGIAGYKALWNPRDGYPSREYLAALQPRFATVAEEKLAGPLLPLGARVGGVHPEAAAWLGLRPGTSVAAANIDAHVSVPVAGAPRAGELMMIMGTSTCHILLAQEERPVPGMCGVVEGGAAPGFLAYEAGQSCVGDLLGWFVEHCLSAECARQAKEEGQSAHEFLTARAAKLRAGESGLIALDWWNGNRSILVDAHLTGLILGMTLRTKPEEIYRALMEATAFGTRTIVEAFEQAGVPVRSVFACGGIAHKNPLMLQIYADVLGREIRVARTRQAGALGSAMFGAVAAGAARGGYDTIAQAASAMGGLLDAVYRPNPRDAAIYQKLYALYAALHDQFGRDAHSPIRALRDIQSESLSEVSLLT